MKRLMIIGSGGAGKSTLSKQLAEILDLPLYHLDAYYWKPGWIQTPKAEWDAFITQLVKEDLWIMDGNYGQTMDVRMARADTILLLDFSKWLTVFRILKRRVIYHGKTRPDLNEGCPESLDFEFVKWVWHFRKEKLPGILAKMEHYAKDPDKTIIHLKSPQDVKNLLDQLRATHGEN